MVLRLTHLIGILLATLALAAPNAAAQGDADDIVRHAVGAMERVTQATVNNVQEATEHGVQVIQRLDANGASDEELIAAARRASRAVRHNGEAGARRVRMIAARAIEALRDTDAGREHYAAIHRAAGASHDTIGASVHRGVHRIQVALRRALED